MTAVVKVGRNGVPPARRILAKRSACLMPRRDLRPAAPRSTVPALPPVHFNHCLTDQLALVSSRKNI